jgi:hypothetical protein
MDDNKLLIKELKILREDALSTLRTKGLVGDSGVVPIYGEKEFSKFSFGEYAQKNSFKKLFDEWSVRLNDIFDRANLDFILLNNRIGVALGNKKNQPAAVFSAMVTELDKIIDDEKKLENYIKESFRPNSWPALTYSNGVVYQGLDKKYGIQGDLGKRFFDLMWKSRRIIAPTTGLFVAKYGKTITRQELFKRLRISNPERLNDIINNTNSAAKRNKMNISVKSPDADTVFIQVVQDLVPDRP